MREGLKTDGVLGGRARRREEVFRLSEHRTALTKHLSTVREGVWLDGRGLRYRVWWVWFSYLRASFSAWVISFLAEVGGVLGGGRLGVEKRSSSSSLNSPPDTHTHTHTHTHSYRVN